MKNQAAAEALGLPPCDPPCTLATGTRIISPCIQLYFEALLGSLHPVGKIHAQNSAWRLHIKAKNKHIFEDISFNWHLFGTFFHFSLSNLARYFQGSVSPASHISLRNIHWNLCECSLLFLWLLSLHVLALLFLFLPFFFPNLLQGFCLFCPR